MRSHFVFLYFYVALCSLRVCLFVCLFLLFVYNINPSMHSPTNMQTNFHHNTHQQHTTNYNSHTQMTKNGTLVGRQHRRALGTMRMGRSVRWVVVHLVCESVWSQVVLVHLFPCRRRRANMSRISSWINPLPATTAAPQRRSRCTTCEMWWTASMAARSSSSSCFSNSSS